MTLRGKALWAFLPLVALVSAPSRAVDWIAAWHSPAFPPTAVLTFNDVRTFGKQTVRQVLRSGASGDRVRVQLTNELGITPVEVGSVHIALSSPYGVTEPETDHALTFGGQPGVAIPIGQAVLSDPVDMKVPALETLAISVYYPRRFAPAAHLSQVRISASGDHGADDVLAEATIARAPALASSVEVESKTPKKVVVAFGDSITEGAGSTPGANLAWPEQLAVRMAASREAKDWVVINSGISGNRLLHDGAGPRALDRFDRDVLNIAGVTAVILLEGINDIGHAFSADSDTGPLSAQDVIGAYQELISRAHARGLKIYGATLTPYGGASYYTDAGEAARQAVNEWIRGSGQFDGVIDFDQTVRDPRRPSRFKGVYQCGDNLHPGDAGYRAMAEAVDLKLFAPRR